MKKLIGSKGFYKMVLAICIPIVIQNGFTNLASLLDNIMIGQLGTLSMSGVSITNQLLQVFNVTIFGAMSGPGIFMAQFYGKKNKEGVENCFRIKLIIGIIITLLAIFLFPSILERRSRASGGCWPVTMRYMQAATAYTSVNVPCWPLLRYCSSGE